MVTIQQRIKYVPVSRKHRNRLFTLFILFACISEGIYLYIFSLSGVPGLNLSHTPLEGAWSWTLYPAQTLSKLLHPIFEHGTQLVALLPGVAFLSLAAVYALAISTLFRYRYERPTTRRWLLLLLGGALVFGVTLLLLPRLFSDDVFTYIFSGRILMIYGADPLNNAPRQFPTDPYLVWVISGKDSPNIYGTLWLCIAALLAGLGGSDPVLTLMFFKGVALFTHLLNITLIWLILGRIAPRRRFLGTFLYAWNPLVLIELAGSGHSEGVLLSLLLLATWFFIQEEKLWYKIAAYLLFGLAISTNLITLLLAPLYLWFDIRTKLHRPYVFWSASWRLLLMLVPALAIALPFWRGSHTFFAITSAIDMAHFVHSPVGTLAGPVRAFFQTVANWAHFPPYLRPIDAADMTLRASAIFIFLITYIQLFSKIQHAPSTFERMRSHPHADREMMIPGFDILLTSCGIAVFCYMILVSGWFWPWYMLWLFWIVVLRRLDAFTSSILVLSVTTLFIYAFVGFTRGPIATYYTALIFGIPLAYLFIARARQRRTERISSSHDRRSQTTQD